MRSSSIPLWICLFAGCGRALTDADFDYPDAAPANALDATTSLNDAHSGTGATEVLDTTASLIDAHSDAITSPSDSTSATVAKCGNGVCEVGESLSTCPADCNKCGDGICGVGETTASCLVDCPASDSPWWPTGRYELTDGAQVVLDHNTGLHWQRQAASVEYNLMNGTTFCQGLALPGAGWRLPSKAELMSLIATASSHCVEHDVFPNMPPPDNFFWGTDGIVNFCCCDNAMWGGTSANAANIRCVR